jgi:large subunit ribosomal protein L34e
MYRSRSVKRLHRVTPTKRHVIHYRRGKNAFPHCAICSKELNGISASSNAKGRSLRTNSRKFGGVLCALCTSKVVMLASRIEHGEMKLNDIGIRERQYVMQMQSH